MTIKSWLFLVLLAPLTVVGCASDETTGDPESSDQTDDLTGTGPNAWQPQSLDLSCTQGVASKVTKTSRRHVFSFAAEAGVKTTFSLSGTWPAGYGARIYVTDPAGQVIATAKQDNQNTVTLTAAFATTGKHTVSVSPVKYQQVAKTYSYKLAASCEGSLRCASASVVWSGSTTPTSYLQNVSTVAEADAFFAGFPASSTFSQRNGACDQATLCTALYKPVCGVVGSDPAHTFSNACSFGSALGTAAGHTAGQGSKGYVVNDGECAPVCDYEQPGKHYVAHSVAQCKLVKYACPKGQTGFGDECGCGCQDVAPVCDYNQPGKHYVAQSPDTCKLVKFACASGQTPFFDDCGCGCAQ